jgi:predicted nicotinamide N-methyase
VPELLAPPAKNTFHTYGIWLYTEKSREIKSLKKERSPSVHGDKHWDSSYLLMDYFTHNPLKKKSRVLDVGCGWGPTSIYLANSGHSVTGLDVDDDVFAFLDVQAELNGVAVKTRQGAMASMKKADLAKYDVIVGGDICFWDELTDEWFAMLKRAASAGVKKLVLADPGRSPFLQLVDKCYERWACEMFTWYCFEPKRFTGSILVVNLDTKAD